MTSKVAIWLLLAVVPGAQSESSVVSESGRGDCDRHSGGAPAHDRHLEPGRQQLNPLHGQESLDIIAESFNVFIQQTWAISAQENNVHDDQRGSGLYRTMQCGFRLLL